MSRIVRAIEIEDYVDLVDITFTGANPTKSTNSRLNQMLSERDSLLCRNHDEIDLQEEEEQANAFWDSLRK
jgi:hypothetical protein